jgi:PTH1 family peptidyl-tRNA hydrolase
VSLSTVVIIGLGNPGKRYADTRHNVGFRVVDALADRLKCGLRPGKGEFLAGTSSLRENDIVLAKPLTSMNESGIAVAEVVEQYEAPLDRLLVVVDDFQIPLGALRMRPSGTDGGHNGLYSVIYHLQSDTFPRLRCGIAGEEMPKDKALMADFVLSNFIMMEKPIVKEMVERAADVCLKFAAEGIDKTMNVVNRKSGDS